MGDWSTQFYRAIRSDDAEMLQVGNILNSHALVTLMHSLYPRIYLLLLPQILPSDHSRGGKEEQEHRPPPLHRRAVREPPVHVPPAQERIQRGGEHTVRYHL